MNENQTYEIFLLDRQRELAIPPGAHVTLIVETEHSPALVLSGAAISQPEGETARQPVTIFTVAPQDE
jgi:hypothetical protein